MDDDFMTYMLLLDAEEDEPKPGERFGCGCLPPILVGLLILVVVWLIGH